MMNSQYNGCFSKILYTNDDILKRIHELSIEINSYYRSIDDKEIYVLGVLDGAFVFCGNILPKFDFNVIFKTVKVSVYGSKTYAKKEDLIYQPNFDEEDIAGKNILILEDLLDTGITLEVLKNKLIEKGAKDVKVCVLFKKDLGQKEQMKVDWYGLSVPNEWIAGFGIDSRGKYRNFKHLGVVKIEKR